MVIGLEADGPLLLHAHKMGEKESKVSGQYCFFLLAMIFFSWIYRKQ